MYPCPICKNKISESFDETMEHMKTCGTVVADPNNADRLDA